MDRQGFADLMHTLARAWTEGDPHTAVSCFADDIIYVEPPNKQRYQGLDELFELSNSDTPMSMTWHHLVFDPDQNIGCGEYTFRGRRQYHGMVIVKLKDGKIRRWREYQYQNETAWPEFIDDSA